MRLTIGFLDLPRDAPNLISDWVNKPNDAFKENLSGGTTNANFGVTILSYLGYRFISVIMLPVNTIGLVVMLALSILTSPLLVSDRTSLLPKYLLANAVNFGFRLLMDSTYEVRVIARGVCHLFNACGADIKIGPGFYAI